MREISARGGIRRILRHVDLVPGAGPILPPVEGMDQAKAVFALRTIPDADRIKAYVEREKPTSAAIIGGGFIGLEMAENLAQRGVKVSLVEMADQVLPPLDYEMAAMVHAYLKGAASACTWKTGWRPWRRRDDAWCSTAENP